MMVAASGLKPDEVEKSYDFFRKGKFFEPTGKISRKKLGALVDALVEPRRHPADRGRAPDPAGRDPDDATDHGGNR